MFVLPLSSIPQGYVRSLIATLACGLALSAGTSCFASDFESDDDSWAVAEATATAVERIDRAYWLCDDLMEQGKLDLEMSVVCSQITEVVKKERFEDDFEAYAAWWRQQKLAQAEAMQTP